jgi:hypothetical protein
MTPLSSYPNLCRLVLERKGSRYLIRDEAGQVLYRSSRTSRSYVAMLLQSRRKSLTSTETSLAVTHRFGRLDLIGKGDSAAQMKSKEAFGLAILKI